MVLLSPSITGWRQLVDLSACVVLAVTCLSQWPFVVTDIRPDATQNTGTVTAGPLSKPCFPKTIWSFLTTPSPFFLQLSQGASWTPAVIGKVQMDGSKPLHRLPGDSDGQHTKPQQSRARAPWWGYCLVGAGLAANPGLAVAEARGHGRWLSWSSVSSMRQITEKAGEQGSLYLGAACHQWQTMV